MDLPQKLNDGTYDYVLVRQPKQITEALSDIALYERVPRDPDYQYSPDLSTKLALDKGQTPSTVGMIKVSR